MDLENGTGQSSNDQEVNERRDDYLQSEKHMLRPRISLQHPAYIMCSLANLWLSTRSRVSP